jgi:hypothetical protein
MSFGKLQSKAGLRHNQDVFDLHEVVEFGSLFFGKKAFMLAFDQLGDALAGCRAKVGIVSNVVP